MSYIDSRQPLMPQQHQNIPGSDAIGVRPQVQANGNESSSENDHQLPLKRPRIFDDASSNSQCISVPANRWTANIFFKTRLCAKFKLGASRNGENCNFSHGMQDRRQPPDSWQELVGVSVCSEEDRPPGNWDGDQRIIHMMKLCRKYYNGEECPYGDRCSFLHEESEKVSRESAAISIGTPGPRMGHGNNGSFGDVNRSRNNPALDAARANMKPMYWKTKLCTK